MGSRQVDPCERVLPSPACLAGMHEECGHWHGSRGAFNYRRLRHEGFTILCRCDCHSSCQVTNEKNTVGDQAWRQSCTCPGAEAMRGILDEFGTVPFDVRDFPRCGPGPGTNSSLAGRRLRRLRPAPLARTANSSRTCM